ncbi:CHC2 zinc finger domain-containing protein [Pseudomonas trivialis]|uniref:CHC2 zinc finger domain-containing protein n=1 Tax=Pseudomonas trivialis TaxID=200450 RepID=UPI000A815A1E|nr:CHC2 zinc finger domain-containing protein [Pseudomonas trivialis]
MPNNEITQLIDKLANSVDIEELAQRLGLSIKRSGGAASTLCIDHNEENPSMRLYPRSNSDKPHYHCYVCGAHGDIFTLVQKVNGLDFIESVKWLASVYGYKQTTSATKKRSVVSEKKKAQSIEAINHTAFEKALNIFKENSPPILIKWLKKRELQTSTGNSAELCVTTKNSLVNHVINSKNYGESRELLGQLESAGLIRSQYTEPSNVSSTHLDIGARYRDFFYDTRIIFPIRDITNLLIGFAARKIDDSSQTPKYLYSPGLPKSQILYRAREASLKINEFVSNGDVPILYVCEGLLDALRLESLGLAAVAVLGSRASDNQAKIVIHLAKTLPEITPLQVRIFLDTDSAGLKGAASTIQALLKHDAERRLELAFVWPTTSHEDLEKIAKDPDEFLKKVTPPTTAKDLLDTHPLRSCSINLRKT